MYFLIHTTNRLIFNTSSKPRGWSFEKKKNSNWECSYKKVNFSFQNYSGIRGQSRPLPIPLVIHLSVKCVEHSVELFVELLADWAFFC